MQTREYAIQCLKDEAQAILDLIPNIDKEFDDAVELIFRCHGKVIVTGVGKSGHIGAKIAATLSSTGTPSFFINPLDVFHGDLGVMTKDDVVLAISNSGQTDELLRFIPMVLHMEIPIIGMSGNPQSLLAKYSSCHLNVSVKKEACPLNLAPTSSTTATLAMGDALGFDAVEISAHAHSAPDHEPVQGRVFLRSEFEKMQAGSDFYDVDGNHYDGFRRPIGEWNCMHIAMAFSTQHSKRRYSDEQLKQWETENAAGCDINGKHYTIYKARQLMRQLETQVRQEKDAANAARINGNDMDARRSHQKNINALTRRYYAVAQAAGLRPRGDRLSVEGFKMVKV